MKWKEILKLYNEKSKDFSDLKTLFTKKVVETLSKNMVNFILNNLPQSKKVLQSQAGENAFKKTIEDFFEKFLEKYDENLLEMYFSSILKTHTRKNVDFEDFILTYLKFLLDILKNFEKKEKYLNEKIKHKFFALYRHLIILLGYYLKKGYLTKCSLEKDILTDTYTKHYFFYNYINIFKNYNYGIYFDIRNFKEINLYYGCSTGDTILSMFSSILETEFPNSIIIRFGPDEFLVFSNTRKDSILNKINSILNLINKKTLKLPTKNGLTNVPINFNCVIFKTKDLKQVNLAKFNWILENEIGSLKKQNKIFKFLEKIDIENYLKNYEIVISIIKNLKEQNIKVALQGIYSLDNKLLFKEALARIELDGKIVTPFLFIDKLKDTSIEANLDKIVIEKVANFLEKYNYPFKISINPSSTFFNLYLDWFLSLISKYPKLKNYLIIEIVERNKLDEVKSVFNFLRELKLNIYIDDFGSSYSNYDFLKALNLNGIKIDGNIVKNVNLDPLDRTFLECILKLAQAKNMQVIAEYVESEDIVNTLKDLSEKLNYKNIGIQGFIFEKPKIEIH